MKAYTDKVIVVTKNNIYTIEFDKSADFDSATDKELWKQYIIEKGYISKDSVVEEIYDANKYSLCPKCNEIKPKSDFRSISDAKNVSAEVCKDCYKQG